MEGVGGRWAGIPQREKEVDSTAAMAVMPTGHVGLDLGAFFAEPLGMEGQKPF